MKLSFPSFAQWRSGVIAALMRFPWNILCGATGAACAIISIHSERNEWLDGQCARLAMAAALGMPLFFSLRILRERAQEFARWPIEILGVPLLALWVYTQPSQPFNGPGIVWVRWLLLLAALHFFAAVSAYVRSGERLGFWQFNRRLFLRFCLATLYTGVLTIGLELALLSADKLFDLKLSKAYGDLFFLMVGLFHPAFFLAGVPRDFAELNADPGYPRGLKAFTQFALAPLVAVYTAILYAYAVKIIATWSWPHGWVALPVLLLSGIGILAALLLSPLRQREEEKWAVWFTTNFPRALAPLSLLLLLSLRVRITEYGFTEQRHLGVVLGVWILAWALVFIIRKQAGIRWVPSSLAVICLLSAFGPWSAGAISKASQLSRLEHMLQAHGMWRDNHAQPPNQTVELSKKEETDLRTTLNYLIGTHGGGTVKRVFEPAVLYRNWDKLIAWEAARDIINALRISSREDVDIGTMVQRKSETFIDVQGFRRIWRVHVYSGPYSDRSTSRCEDVTVGLDFGVLKLATEQDGRRQEIPLESVFNHIESRQERQFPNEELTVDFEHGKRSFRVTFESLTFRHEREGIRLSACEFYLVEK
jgi:hypothetical protein